MRGSTRAMLLTGAALGMMAAAQAEAETMRFDVATQAAESGVTALGQQANIQIVAARRYTQGRRTAAVRGDMTVPQALGALLAGTGLVARQTGPRTYVVLVETISAAAPPPQEEAVPGDIVVTARKREESIQDVPAAITAVTQAELTTRQVTGGPDLITQVPNMSFTKTNFTGYSIQIRGIGTQAISATTDPAVSVAFNNTPFIRNRFFEQEFYDLERIEILRGPQGTLYGRNATAGVVNLISAKPGWEPAAKASVDVGSYKQIRLEGMVNLPLIEDQLALRIAGAYTKRDGYAFNSLTGKNIDGRDLFSTRTSLRFQPNDALDVNLIWEHFQEDDDRLRSGKQLCKTDVLTTVAGLPVNRVIARDFGQGGDPNVLFSQGCKPASLYSAQSFGTPNGPSLPYYVPLSYIGLPTLLADPYANRSQSRDLRSIESSYEPKYRAKANIYELQLSYRLSDTLRLISETAYNTDTTFSTQDFNRFSTAPGAFRYVPPEELFYRPGLQTPKDPITLPNGLPGRTAVFCDPQIGCSDRLIGIDLATANSHQFSQELRLTSDNGGPINFNVGANFLRYRTEDKYYVFFNTLTMIAATSPQAYSPSNGGYGEPLSPYVPGWTSNKDCLPNGLRPPAVNGAEAINFCTYIDPNPIDKLNDLGHNYFLSKNPYRLSSYSAFGELYADLADQLKLTVGARLTLDRKTAPQIPSWVLAHETAGYPVRETIRQRWLKPTGKISLDWKPQLSFTDSTLLYASASRGYKAGGANPPRAGTVLYINTGALGDAYGANSATKPKTFKAEYVNAFEIGAKSELLNRRLTVNLAAFYYDYSNYQISQIIDRAAVNLNFDTKIWGAEAEASWQAADFLSLGVKAGYQQTKLGKGSRAIDTMDRTAGHADWQLVRPFPTLTANCILPNYVFQGIADDGQLAIQPLGGIFGGNPGACEQAYLFGNDPVTQQPYVPNPTGFATGIPRPNYPGFDPATAPNNGEGFFKDLSGNELPNAPHFTGTANADLSLPLGGNWTGTLHGDYYYQGKQWARVFNTPGYDRIRGYANVNLALILLNKAQGWNVLAYVKNVFDKTAITGAFLNSDDTGLTTNIFLTEPRRYGIRFIKEFDRLPFGFGDPGQPHDFGRPYAVTVEGGVQLQRRNAVVGPFAPSFTSAFGSLNAFTGAQQRRHLRWQNGTDVGVTLALPDDWRVDGRVRYGKVGGKLQQYRSEVVETVCGYLDPARCPAGGFALGNVIQRFADTLYTPQETHTVVDFAVGREAALGTGTRVAASLGVRIARLSSVDTLSIDGIPDRDIPTGVIETGFDPYHRYTADVSGRYRFRGTGPVVKLSGSTKMTGAPDTGMVGIDWEAGGGVLFGKRHARIEGNQTVRTFANTGVDNRYYILGNYYLTPTARTDSSILEYGSDTTAVPTLGGSIGLSYTLGRVALKGGYAYDRYFAAIGSTRGGTFDREIHGPYLKLALGFGR